MDNKLNILTEISKSLLNQKTNVVFLFGSGASMSCGLPGSATLKQNLWNNKLRLQERADISELLQQVGVVQPFDQKSGDINLGCITFEQLMTAASSMEQGGTQEEKEEKITKWLISQIGERNAIGLKYFPNLGYEFVCHLMNSGLVKYVINMNYDEILDKAIDDELGENNYVKVVTLEDFELLRNSTNWEGISRHFLIKPHGTISRSRSCRYRIQYIQEFERDKQEVLKKVLERSLTVMVGYEASDRDFLKLLAEMSLEMVNRIVIVKKKPETALKNLGGKHTKILCYPGTEEIFFTALKEALYGKQAESKISNQYSQFYTKATRHFIRSLVHKQVNPLDETRIEGQSKISRDDPLFFQRLNLLVEVAIYCFKVRGLFTRRALASCSRIISALENYLSSTEDDRNPIESILSQLEDQLILKVTPINELGSWYYMPLVGNEDFSNLFSNAAKQVSIFLANELSRFFGMSSQKKNEFVENMTELLSHLPYDFDYDLLKESPFYFLPFKKLMPITRRQDFRQYTEKVLSYGKQGGTIYVMSPSVAEWLCTWGKSHIQNCHQINVIINEDVHGIKESLQCQHICTLLRNLKLTISKKKGAIRLLPGVKYGLTLAFKENNKKISGKAILFSRSGKASAFSPAFLQEDKADSSIDQSDIYRLKSFFETTFNESKELHCSDKCPLYLR